MPPGPPRNPADHYPPPYLTPDDSRTLDQLASRAQQDAQDRADAAALDITAPDPADHAAAADWLGGRDKLIQALARQDPSAPPDRSTPAWRNARDRVRSWERGQHSPGPDSRRDLRRALTRQLRQRRHETRRAPATARLARVTFTAESITVSRRPWHRARLRDVLVTGTALDDLRTALAAGDTAVAAQIIIEQHGMPPAASIEGPTGFTINFDLP